MDILGLGVYKMHSYITAKNFQGKYWDVCIARLNCDAPFISCGHIVGVLKCYLVGQLTFCAVQGGNELKLCKL